MNILLIAMGQSPFNHSIWTGFGQAFQRLGHTVFGIDAREIAGPDSLDFTPDLVLSIHGYNTPIEVIHQYRARNIPTAVYLLDEPYEVDHSINWSRHYDYAFSVDRATVAIHRAFTHADYLPLAYNDSVFKPTGESNPSRILILGSPFAARKQYLSAIAEHWGDQITWVGPGWKEISHEGLHHEQLVSPQECANYYRGADLVINIHRDSTWSHFGNMNQTGMEATHLNPRFWEAAACQSMQLCSYREDIEHYGVPEAIFSNRDELLAKIERYLDDETARNTIAQKLYNKVKAHTYLQRSQQLLNICLG